MAFVELRSSRNRVELGQVCVSYLAAPKRNLSIRRRNQTRSVHLMTGWHECRKLVHFHLHYKVSAGENDLCQKPSWCNVQTGYECMCWALGIGHWHWQACGEWDTDEGPAPHPAMYSSLQYCSTVLSQIRRLGVECFQRSTTALFSLFTYDTHLLFCALLTLYLAPTNTTTFFLGELLW